jgi:hypothetical protein
MTTQRPGGSSKRKLVDVKGDGQQQRAEGVQKKGRRLKRCRLMQLMSWQWLLISLANSHESYKLELSGAWEPQDSS